MSKEDQPKAEPLKLQVENSVFSWTLFAKAPELAKSWVPLMSDLEMPMEGGRVPPAKTELGPGGIPKASVHAPIEFRSTEGGT